VPYILLNNTRPVIGLKPWPTRTDSVFSGNPNQLMFAVVPEFRDEYELAADMIKERTCKQVGLVMNQSSLEYIFWWLLDAPQSGVEIHVLNPIAGGEPVEDTQICAVLCPICSTDPWESSLPVGFESGPLTLYLVSEGSGRLP
jgi:hypothetical protein